MEGTYLDTNVTALLTYPTVKITQSTKVDDKLHEIFLKENSFILLAGIGSQLEIYLPCINVSMERNIYTPKYNLAFSHRIK